VGILLAEEYAKSASSDIIVIMIQLSRRLIIALFMKVLFSSRALFVYGLLLVVFSMSFAIYLQFFHGLEPCSLCVFQRLAYILYAFIIIIALIHHPRSWGMRVYAFFSILPSAVGLAIALRQAWIQSLPADQIPGCGPGLNFLLQEFSLSKVLSVVWAGSSDCAIVTWRFLNQSMAVWSAILFGILILLSLVVLFKDMHLPHYYKSGNMD
jgi:protein dithiol:quinone oxidoreductase